MLGAVPAAGGDPGGDSCLLDAAQLKVAEALQQRLQQELEEVAAAAAQPPPPPAQAADGGRQGEEEQVRLFRRVQPGAPVVDQQAGSSQQQAGGGGQPGSGCATQPCPAARAGRSGKRALEAPTAARCRAAGVEASDILRAAQAAVQRAAGSIASPPGWMPADDDPARWSHRRRRRAAKLEAEAAARRLERGT